MWKFVLLAVVLQEYVRSVRAGYYCKEYIINGNKITYCTFAINGGDIAGVIVGCLVGAGIIIAVLYLCVYRRRRRKANDEIVFYKATDVSPAHAEETAEKKSTYRNLSTLSVISGTDLPDMETKTHQPLSESETEPRPSLLKAETEPQPSLLKAEIEPQPSLLKAEIEPQPSLLKAEIEPKPPLLKAETEPQPSLLKAEIKPQPSLLKAEIELQPSLLETEVETQPSLPEAEVETQPSSHQTIIQEVSVDEDKTKEFQENSSEMESTSPPSEYEEAQTSL